MSQWIRSYFFAQATLQFSLPNLAEVFCVLCYVVFTLSNKPIYGSTASISIADALANSHSWGKTCAWELNKDSRLIQRLLKDDLKFTMQSRLKDNLTTTQRRLKDDSKTTQRQLKDNSKTTQRWFKNDSKTTQRRLKKVPYMNQIQLDNIKVPWRQFEGNSKKNGAKTTYRELNVKLMESHWKTLNLNAVH